MKTMNLPSYAFPYRSRRADGERDLLATFRGDDHDTITVGIERGEPGTLYLSLLRSGCTEGRFSKEELGRMLEVATVQVAHIGLPFTFSAQRNPPLLFPWFDRTALLAWLSATKTADRRIHHPPGHDYCSAWI